VRPSHDQFDHHHGHAEKCRRDLEEFEDGMAVSCRGAISALLAIALAGRETARELRRIRRLLEHRFDPRTAHLNLTGSLVPKQGGNPMPAGPFNPSEQEDVQLQIAPVNAAGQPTPGPFNWTMSDGAAGTLEKSADTKSAKLVTTPGSWDVVVIVTDPRTGISDTAAVSRTTAPADNNTTALNLSGSIVPKVPA
jgi:hypothetical protein